MLIGWLLCDGILPNASEALIPLVDSGNSEDSVDEKLAEGFFERKICGSKRRESERFAEIAEDSMILFYFS